MPRNLTAAQVRLSAARARQRRRALGPPLALSETDLDTLATVSPTDQAEVAAFVRAVAGERAVAMLETE